MARVKKTYSVAKIGTGRPDLSSLVSPVTYDRRGSVIFHDDFENDTPKWVYTAGVGRVVFSTDRCYTGSSSLKLTTVVGEPSASGITKYFLPAYSSRLGLACMFHPVDEEVILTMRISGYTGTEGYRSSIEFDVEDNRLQYYKGEGRITLATNITGGTEYENWIPIKMCIDHSTKKWIRIILGNNIYDIPTVGIEVWQSTELPYFSPHIHIRPTDVAARVAYLDNVIVTQNET